VERQQAAREVQDFFQEKRNSLESVGDPDIRRSFLADMNGIARGLEVKAMELADAGKDVKGVLDEAAAEFEKLRKEYVKRLGGDDPVMAHNRGTVTELESL
jgi:hypothetical protein